MAHFAEIDKNNIVVRVIVINDKVLLDSNGKEKESLGVDFCKSLYGKSTNWVQTSYNNNFKKKFAGIGDTFDDANNAFVAPESTITE